MFLRLCTHKESPRDFFRPEAYGRLIYENSVLNIPRVLDLCVLFRGCNRGVLPTSYLKIGPSISKVGSLKMWHNRGKICSKLCLAILFLAVGIIYWSFIFIFLPTFWNREGTYCAVLAFNKKKQLFFEFVSTCRKMALLWSRDVTRRMVQNLFQCQPRFLEDMASMGFTMERAFESAGHLWNW